MFFEVNFVYIDNCNGLNLIRNIKLQIKIHFQMKKTTLVVGTLLSCMTLFAQAPKRVIVEDFTGTWCGYCPRGKTTVDQCVTSYPTTIGMEVHNGDTYANTYTDSIISGINPSGFPMGAIDRFAFGGSTSAFDTGTWKTKVGTRLITTSPVALDIASTYNTSTRALSVTVTANFVAAASGDLRISCILTEDGVVTSADPQHNYMGNGCSSPDATSPWYSSPCSIPTYVHNGVARINLAPTWGTAGVIPSTVASGGSYSKTYTYTVPSTMNASNVYIVALVGKYGTASTAHEVLNANKVLMGTSTATGIFENHNVDQVQVQQNAPNPFNDFTAIQFQLNTTDNVSVKVFNAIGQEVNTLVNTKLVPGLHTFYWSGDDNNGTRVRPGVYYYKISTSSQSVSKPMVYTGQE